MSLSRWVTLWVGIGSSAGCHAATAVNIPNFDGTRMPEPPPFVATVPPSDHRIERAVRIAPGDSATWTRQTRATLRVVMGSECRVKDQPLCGFSGSCFGMVDVQGDVCVVLVSTSEHAAGAFEPYCHDLSSPPISALKQATGDNHPVWARCAESVQTLVGQRSELL